MSDKKKLENILEEVQAKIPVHRRLRIEELHQKFEKFADKGLVERPTYKLAPASSLPKCLSSH
ncbi:MAG: hypothetical protein IPP10_11605 [Candidatus Competibacteraceae bacterium]|nr:hypothetical protein [Candidatus Competibacteraceae bacterium]MBK8899136.1 hypothetical protein [Candidatus Competibacteraceae bacterium]MBK9952138.1 hypothetical protein [Candidatus Competibacteraceae bacterium]